VNEFYIHVDIESMAGVTIEPYRGYPREQVSIHLANSLGDIEITIDPMIAEEVGRKIIAVGRELKAPASQTRTTSA
jgi:hypothetical protein